MVLVSSTILRISFADVSRLSKFHRAFASSSVFNAFTRSLFLADSISVLNFGLTSLLFCPFFTVFTSTRDWSTILLSCDAARADRSRSSLSKCSEFLMNLPLNFLNSVFGRRPKCASNGEHLIVFCLHHLGP